MITAVLLVFVIVIVIVFAVVIVVVVAVSVIVVVYVVADDTAADNDGLTRPSHSKLLNLKPSIANLFITFTLADHQCGRSHTLL